MSFAPVQIQNETKFQVSGEVQYATLFCSNDTYGVAPEGTWGSDHRGLCLVTKITAAVVAPHGTVDAEPYTSKGSPSSLFAIVETGPNSFQVQLHGSLLSEDELPADYTEPTVQQK